MGLFEKKTCDVCGEKIRLLGSRKLEDGNLCKTCEGKLSPWFTGRRKATVEDIRAQLRDREANRERLGAFTPTRTLGEGNRLLLDDEKGEFVVCINGHDLSDNPDVLNLSQVTDCQVDVERSRTEETTRDSEGKTVSYDPPRFTYSYRFLLTIVLDHPWFDEIRFQVNRHTVKIQTGMPIETPGLIFSSLIKRYTPDVPDTDHSSEYQAAQALAEEMRRALLRLDVREAQAAPAPEDVISPVACPDCTAVSLPDENGCCPYCGRKLV